LTPCVEDRSQLKILIPTLDEYIV